MEPGEKKTFVDVFEDYLKAMGADYDPKVLDDARAYMEQPVDEVFITKCHCMCHQFPEGVINHCIACC